MNKYTVFLSIMEMKDTTVNADYYEFDEKTNSYNFQFILENKKITVLTVSREFVIQIKKV